MRKAGFSVGSNIAEGFGRNTDNEFRNVLGYACGSANEVQSQLYTALDQRYISDRKFQEIHDYADRTKGKIGGLINYLSKPR